MTEVLELEIDLVLGEQFPVLEVHQEDLGTDEADPSATEEKEVAG